MTDEKRLSRRKRSKKSACVGGIASCRCWGTLGQVQMRPRASHGQAASSRLKTAQVLKRREQAIIENARIIKPMIRLRGQGRARKRVYRFRRSLSPERVSRPARRGLLNQQKRTICSAKTCGARSNSRSSANEIRKNEGASKKVAERFLRTIKYATVDGYYTSEIGSARSEIQGKFYERVQRLHAH